MCHKKNLANLGPNSHIVSPENYTCRFVQRVDVNCTNADKIVMRLSACVYCYAEFCILLLKKIHAGLRIETKTFVWGEQQPGAN